MCKLGTSVLLSAFLGLVLSFGTAQAGNSCGEELSGSVTATWKSQYLVGIGVQVDPDPVVQTDLYFDLPCTNFYLDLWASAGSNSTEVDYTVGYTEEIGGTDWDFSVALFDIGDQGNLGIEDLVQMQIKSSFDVTLLGRETWTPYVDIDFQRFLFSGAGTDMHAKVGVAYSLDVTEDITWTADGAASIVNLMGGNDYNVWQAQTGVSVKVFDNLTLSPNVLVMNSGSMGTKYVASAGLSLPF